jgi:CheY-like chemotaxis protein
MDPVQVHQIVANLCINARDAIANGGKITISTGNAIFDEASCAGHSGWLPGEYVLLGFSDNGSGMDQEVIDHLYEPFFSTKETGRGTGLGLATVYGIVQQNNGFIDVRSEPGKGTAFRLFLPRCTGPVVDPQLERGEKLPLSHGENVLVVEDEPAILTIAKMMLEELGYRVFTAATPQEAIVLLKDRATLIHLLIADLVMPGMSGKDLAERLKIWFPDLKALFMSGYSIQAIAPADLVIAGAISLQKPFSLMDLASKVREALKAE